jgi:amino acid adenylation domain-containing protein
MDGWCISILIAEFLEVYTSLLQQREHQLAPVVPYSTYVAWLLRQDTVLSANYWKNHLTDYSTLAAIPRSVSGQRLAEVDPGFKAVTVQFGHERTARIREFANQHQVTVNSVIETIWGIMLAKYNDTSDVVFGSVVSGRPSQIVGIEAMVGLFINTIPNRQTFTPETTFESAIASTQNNTIASQSHQYYPLADIQNLSPLKNNLFDHIVVFENYPVAEKIGGLLENNAETNDANRPGFEVFGIESFEQVSYSFCAMFSSGRELVMKFKFTNNYDPALVERMADHFLCITEQVLANPQLKVADTRLLSALENKQVTETFPGKRFTYPDNTTVQALFEQQVVNIPHATALVVNGESLTYKELNDRANQLAQHITSLHALHAEDSIALAVDRSQYWIISVLAVLKVGATYVPIDGNYPSERIRWMLDDVNPVLLIVESPYQSVLNSFVGNTIVVDAISLGGESVPNPVADTRADSTAYIMFTSGSTGKPKGVMISHKNIIRLVRSTDYVSFERPLRILSTGAISFDATTFEIWGTLLNGGSLHLIAQEQLLSPVTLKEYIGKHDITTMWFTASWFNQLVDEDIALFTNLQQVLTGGEVLSPRHIIAFRKTHPQIRIINAYGPTENTTFSTCYTIEEPFETSIPIGYPIANSTVYILNAAHQPMPIGVEGELYLGGDGVSKGYLNRPELTEEKFIVHPFDPTTRLYKTGDWGKWTNDGKIEFTERHDEQVKVRGYRIELREVSQCVSLCEEVKDAVAFVLGLGEARQLAVAIIPKEAGLLKQETDSAALIKRVKEAYTHQLPSYMVPATWICVDQFRLTVNGKIAYDKLRSACKTGVLGQKFVAPRTPIEEKLAVIFSEVLQRDQISVEDNFFEIGGHSLRAIQVIARIGRIFNKKLDIRVLYEAPSIALLAEELLQTNGAAFEKIKVSLEQEYYDLSHAQRRLWVLNQFSESRIAYNVPSAYVFEGIVDVGALENAFRALIARHESLRTTFVSVGGTPRQQVHPAQESPFALRYEDLRQLADRHERARELAVAEAQRPFDLGKGPLLRATILHLEDTTYAFLFTLHHIISDGWSMEVLVREVTQLYMGYASGTAPSLPPLRIQYKDYVAWQHGQLQGENLARLQAYWWAQLSGELPVLSLPSDHARPARKTYHGRVHMEPLGAELSEGLRQLGLRHGASLFMVLQSLATALLYRYTRQEDIILGTPIAGRDHLDLEGQIGFYVHTLVLRNRFSGDWGFDRLLAQVRETTLQGFAHQQYPFDRLVDDLDLSRDLSRSPLFDIMIVLQNIEDSASSMSEQPPSISVSGMHVESVTSQFDMKLVFKESPKGMIIFAIEYNTDLFVAGRIVRLVEHFRTLASSALSSPGRSLRDLEYRSAGEQEQWRRSLVPPSHDYPRDSTLASLFDAAVALHPDKEAVVSPGRQLTYRQLQGEALRLAHYLRHTACVRPGDRVAILLDRHPHYVVAMLGTLYAGGAYVPLSPGLPFGRLRYLLDDTSPRAVITHSEHLFSLEGDGPHLIALDVQLDGMPLPLGAEQPPGTATDLAYIMYTSGTSGVPKGVAIEHRSVARLVCNTNYLVPTSSDRLLQTGSLSFDASTFEFWSMLLHGGTVYLLPDKDLLRPAGIRQAIREAGITTMWMTSSWFNQLVDGDLDVFTGLRTVLVGGEKLSPHHIQRFRQAHPSVHAINGYGPTENTTFSVCHHIGDEGGDIPLGTPISHSYAYVLDESLRPLPAGLDGELFVGGDGLARGYWNQPELTAERFIADPHRAGGCRLYKTGDTCRYREDGALLYVGRSDGQVKVRGHRIEPSEIEQVLLKQGQVRQALVACRTDGQGTGELVAFVQGGGDLAPSSIRGYLETLLPAYMVPAHIHIVAQMPLTANGKIDRGALLGQFTPQAAADTYQPPRTAEEGQLVSIWEEVLHRSPIGIDDNFFELGGHSLRATQVLSRIYKTFGASLDLGQLFGQPTIRALGPLLEDAVRGRYMQIGTLEAAPYYAVSAGQKRMWIQHQLGQGLSQYNMSGSYHLRGDFSASVLGQVFATLLERHESLRTTFGMVDGEVRQFVHAAGASPFTVRSEDLSSHSDAGGVLDSYISGEVREPFDLERGPLLRVKVVRLSPDHHIVLFTVHHIVSDGWSLQVLMKEVQVLYHRYAQGLGNPLPPLRIHYKEYAAWQRAQLQGPSLDSHRAYARREFGGALPVLSLPLDHPRPQVRSHRGGLLSGWLEGPVLRGLRELSQQSGGTLFITLLAAFKALLYRYSGQEDMVVGTVEAGRLHPDLEDQIGFYVNTLAVRTQFSGADSFSALLGKVRQKVLGAYEHLAYPFDELLGDLDLEWDRGRTPLFDVVLSLQNTQGVADTGQAAGPATDGEGKGGEGISLSGYKTEVATSVFDLVVNLQETPNGLSVAFFYNTDIFIQETIQTITDQYIRILSDIARDATTPLNLLMLTNEENLVNETSQDSALDYEFNF